MIMIIIGYAALKIIKLKNEDDGPMEVVKET